MSRPRLAVLAACLVLPLAACGGKAATAPVGAAAASTTAATATPTPGGTPTTQADAQAITIAVTGGKASGDTGRVRVELGTKVSLTVTADVADEVHVHGYDLMQDTTAGAPVTIAFVADQPGVFEVELEKAKVVLTHLQVQ